MARASLIRPKPREFPFRILNYSFWQEYPDRDVEYVRWYPCNVGPLTEREVWATDEPKDEPLAFYTHVPFCNNKCHSCFYNKYTTRTGLVARYVDALKQQIAHYATKRRIREGEFTSGYFGGGTPTALRTDQLQDLLEHCFRHFNIRPGANISMETTPNEMTREKADVLLAHGIQRISVGVQSFDDALLRSIGRTHTGQKARETIDLLRGAGCKAINVDLMYGLPGETLSSWRRTIDRLIDAKVTSVSLYSFVVVPFGALFTRILLGQEPMCPTEEEKEELYSYAVGKLLTSGFKAASPLDFVNAAAGHLAVANAEVYPLGPPGYEAVFAPSITKMSYPVHVWYYSGEQIPIGSGAYGYVNGHTCLDDPDIHQYVEKVSRGEFPIVMGCRVDERERLAMSLVMGVKLLKVKRDDFRERHGVDVLDVYAGQIRQLEEHGLVRLTDDALEVTYPKGWYYLDNVSKAFYTPANYRIPQPAVDNVNVLKYLKTARVGAAEAGRAG